MKILVSVHAERRMIERGLTRLELLETINSPDLIRKRYEKYYYVKRLQRGMIEIITEQKENHIKVVTLYWL